ncbi:MAG TPA: EAL domain-containing protein, partial [Chromatiales bacterium]|nr:EAL domain-containing protein [Chromatiales bacterium]HEX22734.1 EAL domain-containing protein [Chromatiales bacterium]
EKRRGEMRWATRIGEALEKKQFWLYYQAIKPISAEEPGLFHCELLMRREDEKGELASPEAFIPAAERFNLMPDIDRWVVSTALPKITELARQAAQNGQRVLCGINLSGQSLGDETFYDYVSRLMDLHEVPAEAVCFEITETSAISNLEVAQKFIQKMRARGCRFALDDFGTGVSSFSYLKKLPLDYVKIDGSFIRELLHVPVDEAMVESINRIAHTLGIKTIAEYVESDELLERLRELGTDYAQGYAIAQPAPLDERLRGATAD